MPEWLYADTIATLLLLAALPHLLLPIQTSNWLSKPTIIRLIGATLLLLAIPALRYSGWYARTLFVGLVISRLWRLCFPDHAQEQTFGRHSRRIHGGILLGGSLLAWTLHP